MKNKSRCSRNVFLRGGPLALLAFGTGIGRSLFGAEKQKKYNVLFLMTDEHSSHFLHCYGNTQVETPALDGLARSGQLFTNAYCQNPICVPSRASIITGKMPTQVNTFDNRGGLPDDEITLAKVFRKAGYATEWLGKEHWGGDPGFGTLNLDQETERKTRGKVAKAFLNKIGRLPRNAAVSPYPENHNRENVVTDYAVAFLEANAGTEKPFFLGVSFAKPHFPFTVQEKYYSPYIGKIDLPMVEKGVPETLPEPDKKAFEKYDFGTMTPSQVRKAHEIYCGMVTYIDTEFARILQKVDALGLRENTIILYTSDHGEMSGEHGLWYKNSFYEASARIPHIWSFPERIPAGKRISAPVMNMDIFPTLCELCGIPAPEGLQGKSLLPLMTGKESGTERYALSESYSGGGGRMIRKGKYKYCWYEGGSEQLFDLEQDKDEIVNLINDGRYETVIAELKPLALAGYVPFDQSGRGKEDKPGTPTEVKSLKTSENDDWLKQHLSTYPPADADSDGILTAREWKKYKKINGIASKKK